MEGRAACRATEPLPLWTSAKTPRESEAWQDTRPRAAKAGSSRGQALKALWVHAKSLIGGRSVRGTAKPHAWYRDPAGGPLRRPRIRAQSRLALQRPLKRPAYSLIRYRCPNQNG